MDELQQQQSLTEDSSSESASNSGLGKNLAPEDELKASYPIDAPVCGDFCYVLLFAETYFLPSDLNLGRCVEIIFDLFTRLVYFEGYQVNGT